MLGTRELPDLPDSPGLRAIRVQGDLQDRREKAAIRVLPEKREALDLRVQQGRRALRDLVDPPDLLDLVVTRVQPVKRVQLEKAVQLERVVKLDQQVKPDRKD